METKTNDLPNGIFINLKVFDVSNEDVKSKAGSYCFVITDGKTFKAIGPYVEWDEVEEFIMENPSLTSIYYSDDNWEANDKTNDYMNASHESGYWPTDESPLGAVVQSINCENRGYPSINYFLICDGKTLLEDCLN